MSLRIPELPTTIPVKEDFTTVDGKGFYTLTSDVLPGFVLGGVDIAELHKDVPDAIRIIYTENMGVEVSISRSAPTVPNESLWKVEARQ